MKVKKPNKIVENVSIIDTSSEGKAVAKVDEMVVFVDHGVPGDICDINIYRKKKNFGEAKLLKLKVPSPHRVDAPCIHFGVCGGCKWQHMNYEAQLLYKQKYIQDALTRIGKIELPGILPILGSAATYFYRNKLEFSFSDKKWLTSEEISTGNTFENRNALGFHIPKMFDKILDIRECHLQPEPSNSIRNATKAYALEHGLEFHNVRERHGLLRSMIIRTTSTGEVMVLFAFYEDNQEQIKGLLTYLKEKFPQITSLLYVINAKANDTIHDLPVQPFAGRDFIMEEMEGLKFKIGPKSFYQTNSAQAYELYKVARQFAQLSGNEIVYDLYTGTGTIANFIASKAKKVIGVEYVEDAIVDAKNNSAINNITNTEFYAGDMKDVLNEAFIARHGKPDVIITDPPRAGMHEDVIAVIMKAEPARIVYVSCGPSTQARDLNLLDSKYRVVLVQPVDMFPQTHHVENVVLLERRPV
jgi:23S rRNA (uracil1939-C5)-methyltransferase